MKERNNQPKGKTDDQTWTSEELFGPYRKATEEEAREHPHSLLGTSSDEYLIPIRIEKKNRLKP